MASLYDLLRESVQGKQAEAGDLDPDSAAANQVVLEDQYDAVNPQESAPLPSNVSSRNKSLQEEFRKEALQNVAAQKLGIAQQARQYEHALQQKAQTSTPDLSPTVNFLDSIYHTSYGKGYKAPEVDTSDQKLLDSLQKSKQALVSEQTKSLKAQLERDPALARGTGEAQVRDQTKINDKYVNNPQIKKATNTLSQVDNLQKLLKSNVPLDPQSMYGSAVDLANALAGGAANQSQIDEEVYKLMGIPRVRLEQSFGKVTDLRQAYPDIVKQLGARADNLESTMRGHVKNAADQIKGSAARLAPHIKLAHEDAYNSLMTIFGPKQAEAAPEKYSVGSLVTDSSGVKHKMVKAGDPADKSNWVEVK